MQCIIPFYTNARVVELVDTRDLKSLARNSVPVQVRLRVPLIIKHKKLNNSTKINNNINIYYGR